MGAAVAAVIIRKEKDLVAHFRSTGAQNAESARTVSELGVEESFVWRRLIDRAVIREARPGAYYLDEPSWEALQNSRRRMAIMVILIVVLLAVVLVVSVKH
jgi:hypothetical protein